MEPLKDSNFRDYLANRFDRQNKVETLVSCPPLNWHRALWPDNVSTVDLWQKLLTKFNQDLPKLAELVIGNFPDDAGLINDLVSRWQIIPVEVLPQSMVPPPVMARPVRYSVDCPQINRGHEIADFATRIQAHFKSQTCPSLVLITGWEDEGQEELVKRLCSGELERELEVQRLHEGGVKPDGQICSPQKLRLNDGHWSEAGIRADIELALIDKFNCELQQCLNLIRQAPNFAAVRLTVRTRQFRQDLYIEALARVCQDLAELVGNKLVVFYCIRFDRKPLSWWCRSWFGSGNPPLVEKLRDWCKRKDIARHVIILKELDDVDKSDVELALSEDRRPRLSSQVSQLPDRMTYDRAFNWMIDLAGKATPSV